MIIHAVSLFRRNWPKPPVALPPSSQARAAFGALLGLLLAGALSQVALAWAAPGAHIAWLVAPMAASAVLLFCVPASPLAQPWPVVGGNVVSAFTGIACAHLVPDPMLAAPLAGGLSIAMMFLLRCLHPPGGAVAMTAVLGGAAVHEAGFMFALAPVGLNTVVLLLAALAYNRVTGAHHAHKPVAPSAVADEDIDAALEHFGEALDVTRDDLAAIVNDAEHHAAERRAGALRAGDVMVAPVARLAPDMSLPAAREVLLRHGVPALSVVDGDNRLLGLLTQAQLLRSMSETETLPLHWRARNVLVALASQKPATRVADVMTVGVAVDVGQPATAAATLAARHWLARVPVVDAKGKLAGMAGPAEVLAALHGAVLGQAA
ncbi:HPP family protein [Massilia niastensis]|uniref:HPP family protein n=1 Tax=Massilia niastensis TaxID=544911 RepID=UPI00036DE9AF|nr:HPP family protein [Massilia niastensis]